MSFRAISKLSPSTNANDRFTQPAYKNDKKLPRVACLIKTNYNYMYDVCTSMLS